MHIKFFFQLATQLVDQFLIETAHLLLARALAGLERNEEAIAALQEYLERGGNLLWMTEPGTLQSLEPLADQLGLLVLPGLYTAQIYWFGKPTVYELLLMRHGLLVLPP